MRKFSNYEEPLAQQESAASDIHVADDFWLSWLKCLLGFYCMHACFELGIFCNCLDSCPLSSLLNFPLSFVTINTSFCSGPTVSSWPHSFLCYSLNAAFQGVFPRAITLLHRVCSNLASSAKKSTDCPIQRPHPGFYCFGAFGLSSLSFPLFSGSLTSEFHFPSDSSFTKDS